MGFGTHWIELPHVFSSGMTEGRRRRIVVPGRAVFSARGRADRGGGCVGARGMRCSFVVVALLTMFLAQGKAWPADARPRLVSKAVGVVVLPAPEAERPDLKMLSAALEALDLSIPPRDLAIVESRGVISVPPADYLLVSRSRASSCAPSPGNPQGTGVSVAEIDARIAEAEREIALTHYESALRELDVSAALLPCLLAPVTTNSLYRLSFLKGVVYHHQGKARAAVDAFAEALAVDPRRPWDQTFPPGIWERFKEAKARVMDLPVRTLYSLLGASASVFVDGRPVADGEIPLIPGPHLIQVIVRGESAGGAPTPRRYCWRVFPKVGDPPIWLTPARQVRAVRTAFDEVDSPARALARHLMCTWGIERNKAWVVALDPGDEATEQPPRAIVLRTSVCREEEPPAFMRSEPVPASDQALGGGVSAEPYTWRIGSLLQGSYVLSDQLRARYASLAIVASTPVMPRVDASVQLIVGVRTAGDVSPGAVLVELKTGVRYTWMLEEAPLFAEGGLLGCDCGTSGGIGSYLEVGSFYRLGPTRVHQLEATIGVDLVPRIGTFVGFVAFGYRRGF